MINLVKLLTKSLMVDLIHLLCTPFKGHRSFQT